VILAAVCGAVCQGHAPSRSKVVCSYDGVNSIRVITFILVDKLCKSASAASLRTAASGTVEQAGEWECKLVDFMIIMMFSGGCGIPALATL
jgi:hypothetical protein